MIKGLTYIPNFISEEMAAIIIAEIDSKEWSNELKRRVQHYGYKYNYKKRQISSDMKCQPLCSFAVGMSHLLLDKKLFNKLADQVIVNEYLKGQGISKHIDCVPCFDDKIASLSLLSPTTMTFTSKTGMVKRLLLEANSLVILEDEARYEWMHAIDGRDVKERRVSVTFRNVILT